jgi:hypothetical protein
MKDNAMEAMADTVELPHRLVDNVIHPRQRKWTYVITVHPRQPPEFRRKGLKMTHNFIGLVYSILMSEPTRWSGQ